MLYHPPPSLTAFSQGRGQREPQVLRGRCGDGRDADGALGHSGREKGRDCVLGINLEIVNLSAKWVNVCNRSAPLQDMFLPLLRGPDTGSNRSCS